MFRNKSGVTSIEYAILVFLISGVIILALSVTGVNLDNTFNKIFGNGKSSFGYSTSSWSLDYSGGGFPNTDPGYITGSMGYMYTNGLQVFEYTAGNFSVNPDQNLQSFNINNGYENVLSSTEVPIENQKFLLPANSYIEYNAFLPNSVTEDSASHSTFQNFCSSVGGTYTINANNGTSVQSTCSSLPSSLNFSVKSAAEAMGVPGASQFTD